MIYIDNNTTEFTIPRITNGIGDKVILINQITKRTFELSTDVLNDVGYKVDITDLKLEIGQYDYVVKKNNIPLESGILQVGSYKSQNNQYEVDFNIIQYEPDITYTPLPEKVLDVTENGVYNVESFDKVDVDVEDKESVIIIEQLENQIDTLEDEISTLEVTVSGLETEVNRLDDLKDSLQSQIDSVTTLSVTENGTYIPEEGTLGWNNVEVNVDQNLELITQLESEIDRLEDSISEKLNQIQTLQAENESLNQQIAQKDGDISELEAQIEENNSLIESLQQEIGNLNQQIVDIQAENESLNQQIAQKDGEIENLNQIIEQKDIIIDSNDAVVAELETQINSVTTLSVTENGTYIPEEGTLGWNNVEVNVEEIGLPEQTKSVTYNTNGTYTVIPDEGYALSNVDINVNVTTPTEVWKVPNGMKFGYSTLTSMPSDLDFSNITKFSSMFYGCSSLTTVPPLDTSNGTDFGGMFQRCSNLTTIPQLNTSNGTNFSNMFYNCSSLTTVPQLNTSNGTNFSNMFYNCRSLTTVPSLDTSKGTAFQYMFRDCSSISSVELTDTSKGASFSEMFYNCSKVESIKTIDLSKVPYSSGHSSMFHYCSNLKNVEFEGSINYTISFATNELLTYESVKSILTACSNTTKPTTSKSIYFTRTLADQNGELAALITTCNSKGWAVGGLTLQ